MAKKLKATAAGRSKNPEIMAAHTQENLKKLFFAGLGLADETNERLQDIFNSLVSKGQFTQPKVKKAVNDIRKRVMARRRELEKRLRSFFGKNDLLRSKETQALLKKVEAMEQEVDARMRKDQNKRKIASLKATGKPKRRLVKLPQAEA